MAFRYEVVTESPLAELFRQRFLQNIRAKKCCEVFHLVAPETPNIREFKHRKSE